MKKVCVIGLGYIGLPTAALLANKGYHVLGVDIKEEVIETINKGEIHIVEPDLEGYVQRAVKSGNLIARLKPEVSDVFIIAVPTPFKDDYIPNIDYVIEATESIIAFLKKGDMVILESTSPVGTTQKMGEMLIKAGFSENDIHLAHCPERVLPGKIMHELVENDRIVGGITAQAGEFVAAFYKTFVNGAVIITDNNTAELCKLVENSYRDVNIAFANELSMICEKAAINVWNVIELANRHPRVNILKPGCGVGGHCIAVDPWFIVSNFPEQAKLIKSGRLVNNFKSDWVIQQINTKIESFTREKDYKPVVSIMGLSFKPDIDDLRESPAYNIAARLYGNTNADFLVCEPNITKDGFFKLTNWEIALTKADIVIFLVGHTIFKGANTTGKEMLDFCGITNE